MSRKTIRVFEHERIRVGETRRATDGGEVTVGAGHIDALVRFNDQNQGRFFQPGYRSIQATQYVGYVQIGELGIEILPKADRSHVRESDRPVWHAALLEMLRVASGIDLHTPTVASLALKDADLLEIFVAQLVDQVDRLLREGLAKGYREVEGNRHAFRGRLVTVQNIRRNVVHAERFYVAHQTYDYDTLPNAILHEALRVLGDVSLGPTLRARVNAVTAAFPPLPRRRIRAEDFRRLRLGRNTERYGRALELARLVLLHYSPRLSGGAEELLALLFDMNALWEAYVGRLMRRVAPAGLVVELQASRGFWRASGVGLRTIRPDIVVRRTGEREPVLVVDTKWKRPRNGQPGDADLKQMFAYNEVFGCPRSVLLYPAEREEAAGASGVFASGGHACETRFVGVVEDAVFSDSRATRELAYVFQEANP